MTAEVVRLLAGVVGYEGVDAVGAGEPLQALELVTCDAEGWPHLAWLSAGEVLVVGPSTLALCLWPGSATTANLRRQGTALLQAVVRGRVIKLRLEAGFAGDVAVGDQGLVAFRAEVVEAADDQVAYAEVLAGPTYRLHEPEAVAERWSKQLEALTALVGEGDS